MRRIKEGTSSVLLQSELDEKWWADSLECGCFFRNIQDLLCDGKASYERRFGVPFNPVIPFGAMVESHLISAEDLSLLASVRSKKSCQEDSLDMRCTRVESGKETSCGRHWAIGTDGRI